MHILIHTFIGTYTLAVHLGALALFLFLPYACYILYSLLSHGIRYSLLFLPAQRYTRIMYVYIMPLVSQHVQKKLYAASPFLAQNKK